VEWLILIVMLCGLAAITAALAMMWLPLAVGFVGVMLCSVAVWVYAIKEGK